MRQDLSAELRDVIRKVRRRWRTKLALRGAVGVAAPGLLVFLLSARALESARFTPQAIVTFRVVLAAAMSGLVACLFVRPLLRRVTDEQVAMYLEEHEPTLQASIISALEATVQHGTTSQQSRGLVLKLVEEAVEKARAIESGKRVEHQQVRRYAATIAAVLAAAAALVTFGPSYLRHAGSALFLLSRDVQAAVPYRVDVKPGHATVAKGADQVISARLSGFDSEEVALMVRKGQGAQYERVAMVRGDAGGYDGMLFDLATPVEYFVEAAGVRSPTYTLTVVALPYVQKLELEYHFPPYTGLPPQKVEDGGDIAVLRGTSVRVRAVPTMTTRGGHVVLEKNSDVPLAPAADGALNGTFSVDRDGFYHLDMTAPTGERVTASPRYAIDALADQPPRVSIAKPGRDTDASSIEEVFVEAKADDDFGVKNLELVYSVNGGAETKVRLFGGQKRMPEVSAGHTFYLEELSLEPGDSVAYYARATDNDAVHGAKPAASDMYFVRIRPLRQDFKRAQSQASGGGAGAQQQNEGGLSGQQRKIIAATFNVQRDRKKIGVDKLREGTTVIALSQTKLREQVEALVTQMTRRMTEDASFKKILELLPQAIVEMQSAEGKLRAASPDGALQPEQKALQLLQQAEEEYDVQVQTRQRQGGGGGGGGEQQARDLSDLFEMEVDRAANQYEMRQQAAQQQTDQKLDELAEKLKELARRQEQEAERQRRRAAAGQTASGKGSGASQRELADQVEEAARRLEQLSRDENRADLRQSAEQLRQAADAMRKAAANGEQASGAKSAEALERLRQTERQLQRSQSGRAGRDVADAAREAGELVAEQRDVAGEAARLGSPAERTREQVQRLLDRKGAMEQRVTELEKRLDRSAAAMRQTERDAARKMSEAASAIRDNRVRDKIRYSGSMVRSGMSAGDTENFEREIGSNLETVRKKLNEAQTAVGQTRPDAQAAALARARELARRMDSLGERAREQQAQPGAEGAQRAQSEWGQGEQGAQGPQGAVGAGGRGGRNGGQRPQDGRGGEGDATGPPRFGGGEGNRRPGGGMSPQDARQFRAELGQLTGDARALRGTLKGQAADLKALDEILKNLKQLDDDKVFQDPATFERLQVQATEAVKRFEFNLRRRAELKGNEVFLSGEGEVPEEFRRLVEQYYKSLSKAPEKKKNDAADRKE